MRLHQFSLGFQDIHHLTRLSTRVLIRTLQASSCFHQMCIRFFIRSNRFHQVSISFHRFPSSFIRVHQSPSAQSGCPSGSSSAFARRRQGFITCSSGFSYQVRQRSAVFHQCFKRWWNLMSKQMKHRMTLPNYWWMRDEIWLKLMMQLMTSDGTDEAIDANWWNDWW